MSDALKGQPPTPGDPGPGDCGDAFVAAVRATRMPMLVTNPRLADNPIVFVNDAFCRLSGYGRDEVLGRNCRFLQGPMTDPDAIQQIRDAVRSGQSLEIEIQNYRKSGETFWNRLMLAPVLDSQGALAYFVANQVDVSIERSSIEKLRSTNEALTAELTTQLRLQRDRENEFEFAMRAGRFGTWSLDLITWELGSSNTCKLLFGLNEHDPFTYATRLAAIHPDDRDESLAAIERSATSGEAYDVVYRVIKPSGETRWLASRGQPFLDPAGKPLRLAGVTNDVTDAHRAARMRGALVALADAVRDIADPTDISYVAAKILGETLEISRAGYGLIDPACETILIERDWNAPGIKSLAGTLSFRDYGSYIEDLAGGRDVIIPDARTDPRSASRAAALEAISARAVVNMPLTEHGGLVALLYLNHETQRNWPEDELSFVREVAERTRIATERRRAEIELADLAASLEQQVEARTDELLATEAALRQSQKMEAVGQLTGGLAHDFNNLLTGISGSLELAALRLKKGQYADLDRYLAAAQGAARRAAALTHRLLAFSRRQTLDPKATRIPDLIAGMEELVQRTVGPSINIETTTAPRLWPVLVDPSQLENALLNLCINARDAMPDGGRLTIETDNRRIDPSDVKAGDLEPGEYVSLCVSDTGTGMTPDTIDKAFEPFFTTKPIGQGTGLGLSMIYGFARQSGGAVRIQSDVGQGTSVCIFLPRHHRDPDDHGSVDDAAAHASASAGETVLVVDDEPTIRALIIELLESLGYRALAVQNGPAAMKILDTRTPIDLLITDVGLPGGMNGRQIADAARMSRPELKVLFITGYAENAVLGHGHLERGMHVLTKPFAMATLGARVRAFLETPQRDS